MGESICQRQVAIAKKNPEMERTNDQARADPNGRGWHFVLVLLALLFDSRGCVLASGPGFVGGMEASVGVETRSARPTLIF